MSEPLPPPKKRTRDMCKQHQCDSLPPHQVGLCGLAQVVAENTRGASGHWTRGEKKRLEQLRDARWNRILKFKPLFPTAP